MVPAAEKYASEIEIFTFGRGFRTQISRGSVQKRLLNQSMTRKFGRTDFFNRIVRKQLFDLDIPNTRPFNHIHLTSTLLAQSNECQLTRSPAIGDWSSAFAWHLDCLKV